MLENLERLIRECRTFELAQPMYQGMPMFPSHVPFCFTINRRHHDDPNPNGIASANEVIVTSGHSGTHIDAIGHYARYGKLHQGFDVVTSQKGVKGLLVHGIENTGPILRRSVLLDVASFNGVDALDPSHVVSGDELQRTAKMQGVEIRPGDVVFIRTGWAQYWGDPGKYVGAVAGTPGPDLEGATWLIGKGASLVGSDTVLFEVSGRQGEVHSMLLVEHGVQIVENLNLEVLAKERVYSFLLSLSPLKIVGGTASPVTPLALCPEA